MKNKILIIDDEKDICTLFQKHLSKEGYEVFTAYDGPSGIKAVKKNKPDMIFLDLKMPEMDGIEVLCHLRKIDQHALVVILTGYPSMDTALKSHYLNIYDYVTKPLSLEKIVTLIKGAHKEGIEPEKSCQTERD